MRKGKLYTSNFSKWDRSIGIKISIARKHLFWVYNIISDDNYMWFKDLAPEDKLLKEYKNGTITEEEYTKIYKKQVFNKNNEQYNKLKEILDSGQNVTIHCYCGKDKFCHRYILGNYFKKLGYEVEEIK